MPVFVGRTRELDALAEVAATSASGPVAAVVAGEPGSGKSRLLAEAQVRSALPHSFAVVGYESERQVPLAAASRLLRALGDVPEYGTHVEAVLFDASDPAPLEPVRVFEAAHRAFRSFDRALLVVDDLQWVDELSLALCHYLIRAAHESGQRVVVFAATRPGGAGVSLADALPREQVSWIELTPLDRDDGIELVRALDPRLTRDLAVELCERAKGSPFWIEALARARGSVVGLSQVLTVQLRGAAADAASLLGLLAVAGRPLSVPEAAALADLPLERSEAALRDLLTRGLVVDAGGAVRLAHDLIREAVLAELPEGSRRRLHRRLAERIEFDAGSDLRLLGQALEHRRAARLPTLDLALRLARSPQRKLLGPEGLRLLAEVADEADPFGAGGLELREEVASLAADLAEHEEAQARWFEEGLFERAQEGIEPPLRMVALHSDGNGSADHVVEVEEVGPGLSNPDAGHEVGSSYLPGLSRGDFAGMVFGIFGTIIVAILAAAVSAGSEESGAQAAAILIAIGVALVNMAHVVGLTLMESVRYRGGFAAFFRLLALVGTPLALLANLLLLILA